MTESTEYYDGSDCTGLDGDVNRVLTLTNFGITSQGGFLVYVSGLSLSLTSEYTVSHLSSSSTITFLNPLFDDMLIVINYHQNTQGTNDFENGPLNDLGVTITRTPVTVTTNFSGQKTYTEGSTNTIEAVFVNRSTDYALDKSGLTEVFDAKIYIKATETLNKYDKITYDSKDYRVDKITLRKFTNTEMFKSVNLFFIDE